MMEADAGSGLNGAVSRAYTVWQCNKPVVLLVILQQFNAGQRVRRIGR